MADQIISENENQVRLPHGMRVSNNTATTTGMKITFVSPLSELMGDMLLVTPGEMRTNSSVSGKATYYALLSTVGAARNTKTGQFFKKLTGKFADMLVPRQYEYPSRPQSDDEKVIKAWEIRRTAISAWNRALRNSFNAFITESEGTFDVSANSVSLVNADGNHVILIEASSIYSSGGSAWRTTDHPFGGFMKGAAAYHASLEGSVSDEAPMSEPEPTPEPVVEAPKPRTRAKAKAKA